MAAYHLEALRRQRVIDRKVEALIRIEERQEEEERRIQEEQERYERLKKEEEEAKRREREEHLRQRSHKGAKVKVNKQVQVRSVTREDLRQQEKVLRDHGLVMGHVNQEFLA